jgi:multidrug resistance efflux pump
MKSFNFKRTQSVFETLSEPKRKKSAISFDRLMYFVVLIGIFIGLLFYFGGGFIAVKANGHVLFDKVFVRLSEDIFIQKMFVNEGDFVKMGDTLFVYENLDENKMLQSKQINKQESSWNSQQIIQTQNKINQIQIDQEFTQQKIIDTEVEIEQTKLELSLDIQNRRALQELKLSLNKEKITLEKLNEEKKNLEQFLSNIENQQKNNLSISNQSTLKYFVSPMNANITKLNYNQFETVLKGNEVLSLHNDANIYIRGYFEQKDLKYIEIGDELDIYFPDGTKTIGVVNRFYHSTYTIANEFQKKHEPTKRVLGLDISPKNKQEKTKWKSLYKLGVEIKKYKF